MENTIVNFHDCICGAVTIYFENGENNSIKRINLKKYDISLNGLKPILKTKLYNCNHCINHYGLDLCQCGSGETPNKCCNKKSREKYGKSVNTFEEMKFIFNL